MTDLSDFSGSKLDFEKKTRLYQIKKRNKKCFNCSIQTIESHIKCTGTWEPPDQLLGLHELLVQLLDLGCCLQALLVKIKETLFFFFKYKWLFLMIICVATALKFYQECSTECCGAGPFLTGSE